MNRNEPDPPDPRGQSLRSSWAGDCDTLIIDSKNYKQHLDILRRAYTDLYLPAFPAHKGDLPLERIVSDLGNPESNINFKITIAGENLRGEGSPVLKGMTIGSYLKESSTGYLSYIIVNSNFRTGGLGHALFKIFENNMLESAHGHGKELRGLFLDCANPAHRKAGSEAISPEDSDAYDAQKRVDKYKKWGGAVVPCDYSLPSSSASMIGCYVLMSFPHPQTGQHAAPEAVKDFARDLYKDCGCAEPESNLHYIRMAREISQKWAGGASPLAGNEHKRNFPSAGGLALCPSSP